MKNILVIHQSSELYGSDKTLLLLLSELDKTEFCPVVILPDGGPLKTELENQGIKVIIAPVLKVYRKMFTPVNLIKFFKEVRSGIKLLDRLNAEYKFSFIYSNTLAVLLGMLYARKRNIKHLWHVHEIIVHPKIIASTFPKLLKKYADVIVCNSYATKLNLTQRIPELEEKCTVVHNGLEIPFLAFEIINAKENFGFAPSDIVVTLVGRINRLKGHKWLLEASLDLLKADKVKLLFVGSPVPGQEYYQKEIEQIIADNNLENKVVITPFTRNLALIWAATDIAVMPSTEAESFGLVALEAMLAHKPVIGSDHGGLKEIILHDATGLLVEPSNIKKLEEVIEVLAENENLRKDFGERGHERAITEFSLEKYVSSMTEVFRRMNT